MRLGLKLPLALILLSFLSTCDGQSRRYWRRVMSCGRIYTGGINDERNEPLNITVTGLYEDGKSCKTGQAPWTPKEIQEILYYEEIVEKKPDRPDSDFIFIEYDESVKGIAGNCRSKKCYFDGGRYTWTCGRPAFETFRTCAVGLMKRMLPVKEAEVNQFLSFTLVSTKEEMKREVEEMVQWEYGRHCVSGRCDMDWRHLSAVCNATDSAPPPLPHSTNPILILAMLVLAQAPFLIVISPGNLAKCV